MRGMHSRYGPQPYARERSAALSARELEQQNDAAIQVGRRLQRREMLKVLSSWIGIPVGQIMSLIGIRIVQSYSSARKEGEQDQQERHQLADFIAQFSEGELLDPADEKTCVQHVRSEGLPERVLLCLNDLPRDVLPQLAQALAKRGVRLEHVLLSPGDENSGQISYGVKHPIYIESLFDVVGRLRQESEVQFSSEYGDVGMRQKLLQVLPHYSSVSSGESGFARRVIVLLRDKKNEPEVRHRHLMDDLWQSSIEGGPEYAVIEIGDRASSIPPREKEPIPELVVAAE